MTGHQPHPGTAVDGMGRPATLIKVEDVVKGCGVKDIHIVDPSNIKETSEAFAKALAFKGPSVVVSKSPCILLEVARKRKAKEAIALFTIDQTACKRCKTCIGRFGCPAFYFGEGGSVHIDPTQCNGCGVCVQVCPFKAIHEEAAP